MWYLVFILFFNALRLSTMDVISNRYCADMRPESYVTIEQLLGMWYGVELVNHNQNQEYFGIQYVDSCPIIHISEDHSPTAVPYYKGNIHYPYGANYEPTYQDGNYQQRTVDNNNQGSQNQGSYGTNNNHDSHYGRTSHRGSVTYPPRRYGSDEYLRKYADEIKRLRLLWSDNGGEVEYTLRYQVSKPGFWISSGPYNGSSLEPHYNQFAGIIQVIKAHGNLLALTFCRQLPDQQLYTIILSRIPTLMRHEISDVHDHLIQRALEINNIKRVCGSHSRAFTLHIHMFLLIYIIGINLLRIFKMSNMHS